MSVGHSIKDKITQKSAEMEPLNEIITQIPRQSIINIHMMARNDHMPIPV